MQNISDRCNFVLKYDRIVLYCHCSCNKEQIFRSSSAVLTAKDKKRLYYKDNRAKGQQSFRERRGAYWLLPMGRNWFFFYLLVLDLIELNLFLRG